MEALTSILLIQPSCSQYHSSISSVSISFLLPCSLSFSLSLLSLPPLSQSQPTLKQKYYTTSCQGQPRLYKCGSSKTLGVIFYLKRLRDSDVCFALTLTPHLPLSIPPFSPPLSLSPLLPTTSSFSIAIFSSPVSIAARSSFSHSAERPSLPQQPLAGARRHSETERWRQK